MNENEAYKAPAEGTRKRGRPAKRKSNKANIHEQQGDSAGQAADPDGKKRIKRVETSFRWAAVRLFLL